MNKKKKLIMIGLVLFSISIITLGSYALYNTALITGDASISSGEVKMSYSEKNEITLSNALPIKDNEGKLLNDYFNFNIMTYIKTNVDDSTQRKLNYNIILEPLDIDSSYTKLNDSEIKVYLTKVENGVETTVVEPTTINNLIQYVISSQEETFSNNKSEVVTNYRLRVWIDEDVDTNKFTNTKYSYKFRVNVNNEEAPVLTALAFAKSNVGTDGLETVTHTIDSTLQVDSNFATEYRYRGGDVSNYVTFNNETWRIIGILPTEDTDGNVEYRFKIIRNESIGSNVWNGCLTTTEYKECVDTGKYLNDWTGATLNTYLNGDYYNSLTSDAQSMIGTVKYYLGGYSSTNITVDAMWQYERKNNANRTGYYYDTNPVVQSDASKKIALMYASDYGYAAPTSCSKTLYTYESDANCKTTNNWLDKSQNEWILPQYSGDSRRTFFVGYSCYVSGLNVIEYRIPVRPVLYLSSNVKISGGSGTSSNPYTLSL